MASPTTEWNGTEWNAVAAQAYERIAPHFARSETRARAWRYLQGLPTGGRARSASRSRRAQSHGHARTARWAVPGTFQAKSDVFHIDTPRGLKSHGFSGHACGNPLRSRLTGLPGPTARFLVRRAGTYSSRTQRHSRPRRENGKESRLQPSHASPRGINPSGLRQAKAPFGQDMPQTPALR
jgi:hypothetical protein